MKSERAARVSMNCEWERGNCRASLSRGIFRGVSAARASESRLGVLGAVWYTYANIFS